MKMERSFKGEWSARDLGAGAWVLTDASPAGAEIHLTGVEAGAARLLGAAQAARVTLSWGVEGVVATLVSSGGAAQLRSRSATVHEPLPRLYESLPLERLDARARRFWRRVFLLVRIPGGRRLLGLIARRSAASKP